VNGYKNNKTGMKKIIGLQLGLARFPMISNAL
jgi:hypothetical protein